MPSVSTDNNNAIVLSHSNGTAGTVGSQGLTGPGGNPGQSFGNWAVGSGVPNPVSDLNAYVDENGSPVTLFNGSYYIDTQTGDVWEFTLYSTPQITQGGSNIYYGTWNLTGANYAGIPGPDSYKEDVLLTQKGGGFYVPVNKPAIATHVSYSGTQITGGDPTTIEVIAAGRQDGPSNLNIYLESHDGQTIYAESLNPYSNLYIATDKAVILPLTIQNSFPIGQSTLRLRVDFNSTTLNARGYAQVFFLHIY
jgi:hypothetical protein